MFNFAKLAIIPFAALSVAQGAVWQTTNEWNDEWDKKFQDWMRSSKVHEKMFVDKSSPYYGIKADCADAGYALRAIFASENGLPFALVSPSGSRTRDSKFRTINNETSNFDRHGSRERRVVAFVNYIGLSVGSENLTRMDTYPIAINEISSTDFFSYRINARLGNYIRHVYNIKNVNPVGTFDVIYSTQAIANGGLPMIRRKEREFVNLPHDAWGFRRYKRPDALGRSNSYSLNKGYSEEQYALVKQLGARFFPYVKKTLASVTETPNEQIRRGLTNLCSEAQARIEYVNQGVAFNNQTRGRCMDYAQFDAYSTPARDAALKQTFLRLKESFEEIRATGKLSQVDANLVAQTQGIFFGGTLSDRDLLNNCAINYRPGVSINLKELWRRVDRGLLSSHPNDKIENRWGETTSGATRCRAHY